MAAAGLIFFFFFFFGGGGKALDINRTENRSGVAKCLYTEATSFFNSFSQLKHLKWLRNPLSAG